jgi:hypothetical protein
VKVAPSPLATRLWLIDSCRSGKEHSGRNHTYLASTFFESLPVSSRKCHESRQLLFHSACAHPTNGFCFLSTRFRHISIPPLEDRRAQCPGPTTTTTSRCVSTSALRSSVTDTAQGQFFPFFILTVTTLVTVPITISFLKPSKGTLP